MQADYQWIDLHFVRNGGKWENEDRYSVSFTEYYVIVVWFFQ